MIQIVKLITLTMVTSLSTLLINYLISTKLIDSNAFPFANYSGVIVALTFVISDVIILVVGLAKENKEMKDQEVLKQLISECIKPLSDKVDKLNVKVDKLSEKVDKLSDNQIALVTELKSTGLIKITPLLTK